MSDEVVWRGCSIKEIHRNLSEWELKHVQPIRPSDNHAVLYHWPHIDFNELPQPQKGHNKWDAFHVRLPCSPKSQYPVTQSDGSIEIENRWLMIKKALSKPIRNSQELEIVILSYNSKYQNIWKFRALHKLFEEELEEEETLMFFDDLLPKVIQLALSLPEIITSPIPLLKQGQNRSISMSQQQVACLLANAFLCTFPRRNTTKKKSEYSSFPDINFNRLFQSSGQQVLEKIKCICHYFRRVCDKMPTGILTFIRRSLSDSELPKWDECDMQLGVTSFHITSSGTIENQGQGLLQVDFANKFLGGGVLGSGCVQEEIRFVICPELIISKLFTEALKPFEALLMIGCEQFSKYKGYASTFTWDGNYEDKTPTDDSGRRQCHIVAIDALYFVQSSHQYREELIMRELNKAYVGFVHTLNSPAPGVASGNWGCGAFGGEASLKALIQLMACTVTRRPLVYFTFGNKELRDDVYNMYNFFKENNITVKQLWKYLREFHDHKLSPCDLYSFIIQIHRDNQQVNKSNSLKSNLETLTLSTEATLKTPRNTTKTINHISNTSKVGSALRARSNDSVFRKNIWQRNVNLEETKKCFENIDHHKIKTEDKSKETRNNSITSPTKQGELFKSLISPRECTSGISEKNSTKSSCKVNKTQSNTSEKLKSPVKNSKGKDLKQRSLLDMLDVFYTGERSAKRLCIPHQQKK